MFIIKPKSLRSKKIDQYLHEQAVERLTSEPVPRESHETKVYKALKHAGKWGAYNYELARVCIDWHRRIGDMRAQGIIIQHVRTPDGQHKYYLVKS